MLATLLVAAIGQFTIDPTILSVPIAAAAPAALQLEHRAWLDALEGCEDPDGDPDIRVLDTNGRYSYGLLQFQMRTWLNYQKLGATRENITDQALQETVASYILDRGGKGNWWTCAHRAAKRLGPWPKTQPAAQ